MLLLARDLVRVVVSMATFWRGMSWRSTRELFESKVVARLYVEHDQVMMTAKMRSERAEQLL